MEGAGNRAGLELRGENLMPGVSMEWKSQAAEGSNQAEQGEDTPGNSRSHHR